MSEPAPHHGIQSARDRRRHDAAVAAEISKLERSLRELGPMPCDRLANVTHADRWREGTFEEAVAVGVREGRLARLPFQWLKAVRGARL
ncbi:MAG TPA: hypothetical protein VGI87_01375 [Solirubrobacteraceae bacterium]